jgi:death-on-curing family protein
MLEIYCNGKDRVVTLTTDEIVELHEILCKNYDLLPEMEPVSPAGIKDKNLLESAVSRQTVGSGEYYKYSNIYSNCATLVFGLVKNHSFHNGNKRIGFLAMIKHLYLNGYVICPEIRHKEIYELLRTLANSTMNEHAEIYFKHYYKQTKRSKWTDQTEIEYLTLWLKRSTEHKNTKIKPKSIPVNDLTRILKVKNLKIEFDGKHLSVSKQKNFIEDLLFKKTFKRDYLIKDYKNVPLGIIEQIRTEFGISFQDGVDNSTFFNEDDLLSNEIMAYKKIIYKLAKT